MSVKKVNHIFSADLIRVLAILGVVIIHADAITASTTNYFGGVSWWFANILHSAASVSVPLFVMLSGYLIINKNNLSFKYYLNKSLFQILLPMVFWTLIYFRWYMIWCGEQFSAESVLFSFFTASNFHLYYLFIVIGLYLFTPLLLKAIRESTSRQQKQFFIYSLLFGILILALRYFVFRIYSLPSFIIIFMPYISYYYAGYFLGKINLSLRKAIVSSILLMIVIIATAMFYFVNVKLYLSGNNYFWTVTQGNFFWEHFAPNTVAMVLLLFLLLVNIKLPKGLVSEYVCRIFSVLSRASFGVYLIHPIIIDLLDHYLNLAIHLINYDLWWYLIKKVFLVYIISTIVVIIVNTWIKLVRMFVRGIPLPKFSKPS